MGDKLTKRFSKVVFVIVGSIATLIAFQNCGKVASSQAELASTSKLLAQPEFKEKQVIVRMSDDTSNDKFAAWALSKGLKLENEWPSADMTHWSWEGALTVQEFMGAVAQIDLNPDVVYIEPNFIYHESTNYTLDQVLSFPTSLQTQTSVNIQQSELWTGLTPGKEKPIVAVIDTGIDTTHDTFVNSGALWVNPGEIPADGIDNDNNGLIDDVNGYNFRDKNGNIKDLGGHGTHCAGIVLGVGQNIFKVPIDPAKIQIMALKFIGPDGGATSDAINAIFYAVNHGAKVISNSWGGPSKSAALEDAIKYAYDREVVFIAAAGNSAQNIDATPTYPASYKLPNVISVAATDSGDRLASFSNYGPGSVDLGAPGVSILSTYPSNMFSYLSGTSMATPFVAGTAILQVYERPSIYANQLKNVLLQKADGAVKLAGKTAAAVRLNSNAAVQESKAVAFSTAHPGYITQNAAAAASDDQGKKGGCGTIAKMAGDLPPPPNPPWGLIAFLLLPIAVALRLRNEPIRVRA